MTALRSRRGACYLVCFAGTPYKHAGHYLGFAYPDADAVPDPGVLAEVLAARHTRLSRYYLTSAQAAGVALRVALHRAGRGSRLLAAVSAAGIEFAVTRVWVNCTEGHEKALKDLNDRRILCPACNPGTSAGNVVVPKRFRRKRAGQEVPGVTAA